MKPLNLTCTAFKNLYQNKIIITLFSFDLYFNPTVRWTRSSSLITRSFSKADLEYFIWIYVRLLTLIFEINDSKKTQFRHVCWIIFSFEIRKLALRSNPLEKVISSSWKRNWIFLLEVPHLSYAWAVWRGGNIQRYHN